MAFTVRKVTPTGERTELQVINSKVVQIFPLSLFWLLIRRSIRMTEQNVKEVKIWKPSMEDDRQQGWTWLWIQKQTACAGYKERGAGLRCKVITTGEDSPAQHTNDSTYLLVPLKVSFIRFGLWPSRERKPAQWMCSKVLCSYRRVFEHAQKSLRMLMSANSLR